MKMSQLDMFREEPSRKTIGHWGDLDWWGDKCQKMWDKLEGQKYCPHWDMVFTAFNLTNFQEVKVVIIGQDPYPNPKYAHGLAFSVPPGITIPKSLRNIFLEMRDDIGCEYPQTGYLVPWAEQGVLLLNAVLTVEIGKPMSHSGIDWQDLTHEAIRALVECRTQIIFMMWGDFAFKTLMNSINNDSRIFKENGHYLFKSSHPSPMAAHMGFMGSKPFSKINKALEECGKEPIEWCL